MLVSVGGMELRGLSKLPKFLWLANRSLRQAKAADGCIHVELFRQGSFFLVLSVWETPADMKQYAQNGLHRDVMERAHETTISARNHSYQSDRVPSRDEANESWLDAAN